MKEEGSDLTDMASLLSTDAAERGDSLSQQCCSCDAPSARCWCQDCNEPLCDACVSAHRRVTVTRSHRILNQPPAGRVSTPPIKFCRLHPSEPLKLFCFTCMQLTCRDCQLMVHMNHRYQFVSVALDRLKKHLEVLVQSLRANRDTARQSLLDMETRLQDIDQSESNLKMELQRSYNIIVQQLKRRMEDLLKEVKSESEKEREQIQRRKKRLQQLQQSQQSATETAEKAQNISDLSALLTYSVQLKCQLKDLLDQNLSPPQTMTRLNIITDRDSVRVLLNFGELSVSWIPFSVSQTSIQSRDTPAAAPPLTPTCPPLSFRYLLENNITVDTAPPVPVSGPSASWKSSSDQSSANQSTTTTSVTSTGPVNHLPSSGSKLLSNLSSRPVQPVSASVNQQPAFGQSLVHIVQPTAILLNDNSTVYQVSCLPQFPMVLSQMVPFSGSGQVLPAATSNAGSDASLNYHSASQTSSSNQLNLPPSLSCSSYSAVTPPTGTCPAPTCRPLPLNKNTSDAASPVPNNHLTALQKISFDLFSPPPSSFSSTTVTPPTSTRLSPSCRTLPQTGNTSDSPVPVSCQLSVDQAKTPVTKTTTVASNLTTFESCHLDLKPKEDSLPMNHVQPVFTSVAAAGNQISVGPSHTSPTSHEQTSAHRPVKEESSTAMIVDPLPSPKRLLSDISSSSLMHQPQSPVVLAVADSACEHSVQQVAARRQEPAENEPTSTVSEETEPAGKPSAPEVSDRDVEGPNSVIGRPDYSLNQWQPRVSLLRLPVRLPSPGCPLPGFRLVFGEAEDEIYLEEIREDAQSPVDDITEPLSPPESPGFLEIIGCSVCGSANASIICSACGRGYHRDCHVPPVGPDIWSEWNCFLCEEPSNPHSSDRPQSPCRRLLEQRAAAANLNELQQRLQSKLMETFSPELHPSVLTPPSTNSEGGRPTTTHSDRMGSKVTAEEQQVVTNESKLMETRKRLRDFLGQAGNPKRTKKHKMED